MCFDTQENVLKKNSPAVENRKGQSLPERIEPDTDPYYITCR